MGPALWSLVRAFHRCDVKQESEQAAVEDGLAAYENLLSKLTEVPTPAGPTPRQIGAGLVQIISTRTALPTLMDNSGEIVA